MTHSSVIGGDLGLSYSMALRTAWSGWTKTHKAGSESLLGSLPALRVFCRSFRILWPKLLLQGRFNGLASVQFSQFELNDVPIPVDQEVRWNIFDFE